jgi:two-component system C4-dicarboxylate transport sensor histidine kinase DctB
VILSPQDGWKFRPLTALGPDALAAIAKSRPYGENVLEPLDWKVTRQLSGNAQLAWMEGVEKLTASRKVDSQGWLLMMLDDMAPIRAAARNAAVIAALAGCVAALLLLIGFQRRRARQAMQASQVALQVAHDSLESRVVERTAELRQAQAALVHAEKMGALGQMSAGLAHELNQPLAAMRTLSDNARVLLDSHRQDEARGNLERIGRLVDRLGRLTRQLKLFSRRSGGVSSPVLLKVCIASALSLHAERLREVGVQVDIRIEPPNLRVLADDAQLEQVFVNLAGNAIDAVAQAPERRLRIDARVRDGRCLVDWRDSGPGIREDILPRLFEPFVTSKPAGAGLGLGLLISASILRDFGGSLSGWNPDTGGACFTIELEPAEPAEHADHA